MIHGLRHGMLQGELKAAIWLSSAGFILDCRCRVLAPSAIVTP
jgi:hypothetical protein